MKDQLEAILFAAGRYVDEDFVAKLLGQDVRRVRKALSELKADYDKRQHETALQIVQEEKSWKLHVQDKYLDIVSKLVSDKEIAKTVLETLAICAWKNPITQAELIKYRGPAAYEHVGELIERGFLTKQPEGRSFKLNITDKFFEYFDVEGREDIRKLFSQVEQKTTGEQEEIDKQKQTYEAQKTLADATAKALAEGKEPPTAQSLGLENTGTADSAHSAKEGVKELISEAKAELEKFKDAIHPEAITMTPDEKMPPEQTDEQEESETMEELEHDVEENLAEFGKDVEKLKAEAASKHRHPTAHAKPAKHHAAHKKK
jgi:segregation and condensation protein B